MRNHLSSLQDPALPDLTTSEWTLDYPPFFAYFEWLLSQVACWIDPASVQVSNLGHASWQTVYFQRISVILSELVLVYSLQLYASSAAAAVWRGEEDTKANRYVHSSPSTSKRAAQAIALSILLSPGLLIIDHIHFQYNGLLYGILVLSLTLAAKPSTLLWSGVLFAFLLCMKHIYLYLAPAYFIYLLRAFCLGRQSILEIRFRNSVKLASAVLAVFFLAFGPFIYLGQVPQLLSRLFPFSRGLCHAYWAPNAWAIYSFVDRLLLAVAPRLGWRVNAAAVESTSRGLVGDTSFALLPEITPKITFALTLFFQLVRASLPARSGCRMTSSRYAWPKS
ncbi:MAG: glycosyl transferase [Phylliscum demangeonii]|nr:MAG: glycosyl transferase [Phylliscum demangeonii]